MPAARSSGLAACNSGELRRLFVAYYRNVSNLHADDGVKAITVFFLLLIAATPAVADLTGLVVGITDGDTISVMHDGKAEKIRLYGIDCPEKRQAFGQRAKQYASELAFNKTVMVKDFGKDWRGRTVADVLMSEDMILNHEMVGAGLCWWYRKYAPTNTILEKLEAQAREERRGLWADAEPVAPWEWRHKKKAIQR